MKNVAGDNPTGASSKMGYQSLSNDNSISQDEGGVNSFEKKSVGDIDELINGQYDEYEEEIRILETEKKY